MSGAAASRRPAAGPTTRAAIEAWARRAAEAAEDKQASDVVILDVSDVLVICDVFVITSAPNTRLVRTVVEEVERAVKAAGGPDPRIEGTDDWRWVLMDFGGLVVHVFLEETRRYYELERLFADVPVIAGPTGPAADGA